MNFLFRALLGSLMLAGVATTASAQDNNVAFRVGNWTGFRYVDANGRLDRCSAVAQYGDKMALSLTMWSDQTIGFKISNLGWGLEDGSYGLDVVIDRSYLGRVDAAREEPYKVSVNLGRDLDMAERLARGRYLHVRNDDIGVMTFPLVKSSAAIPLLQKCVQSRWVKSPADITPVTDAQPVLAEISPAKGLPPVNAISRTALVQNRWDPEINLEAFGARH